MKDINNQMGLNSVWTDSLTRNLHPDSDALVDHLRSVHQEHTGSVSYTHLTLPTKRIV